jgi:hypothetical protein
LSDEDWLSLLHSGPGRQWQRLRFGALRGIARTEFMNIIAHRFRRMHFDIFLGFALVFSTLTFWAVMHMPPGDWNDWRGTHPYRAALLTICGPFTPVILRPFAPYCWEVAWWFFPYCAVFLFAGGLLQLVPFPFQRGARSLRISGWVLGLLGWFVGGFVSLMCSME